MLALGFAAAGVAGTVLSCAVYGPGTVAKNVIGSLVGALKMPTVTLPAILKGRSPPRFTAGSPLGAELMTESGFCDVYLRSTDGTRLHAVEDDGKRRLPGKRSIVMVHGFPELWVSWRSQLSHFAAAGHPVLALSMRGYGLSDKPAGLGAFDTVPLTQDIRAAVAHASGGGDLKPLLVAHDWGAGVCWPYVSHASGDETVAGYVSLSNPPSEAFAKGFSKPSQIWASAYMIFFNCAKLPEWILLLGSAWFTGLILNDVETEPIEPRLMNAYRANVLQPGAMTAQLDYYRAALTGGSDTARALAKQNRLGPKKDGSAGRKLPLPVLMVRGKQDIALLGGLFEKVEDYLADSRLVELDDCSHWVQHDASPQLNKEIESFLAELSQ